VLSDVVFKMPFWAIAEKQVKAYAEASAPTNLTLVLSKIEELRGI
jgi:hypothetical protein